MDLADVSKVSRELLAPVRDLGEYIREQRTAAQISLRALAAKAGVSNPYLSQVERGLRRPSAAILAQIADGLSISAESLLVKAGILRPTEATPVIAAIRADEHLSERQKSSLTEIYLALRAQSGEQHADRPGSGQTARPGSGRASRPDSGHPTPPAGDRPIPASPDEGEATPETEE